ncbi:hypothetical protein BSKO_13041 [Bryopsis sp. KO-2023]|nr:hypothetical protein BSKO_13041 [Bryopsis sp. KO-2023]
MTVFQYATLKKKTPPGAQKPPRKPSQKSSQPKKSNKTKGSKKKTAASGNGASRSKILFDRAAFHARPCVAGMWKRDNALSDKMTPLYKLASLGWLARKKQESLQYLEIEDTPRQFSRTVTGQFHKISDTFPVGFHPQSMPRWYQKRGNMKGMVEQTPSGPRTWVKWGDPQQGLEIWELYGASSDGQTLTVYTSALSRDGLHEIMVKSVYTRIAP